ncbi:motility associated factor glycosyltransferase family protein [Bacillus smithii]|uniref:motility associated factor glycosyltransferase family protein n=1 Tax=Bacillus smithii TaxID=1479 RepID=UPI0030C94A10
MILVDNRMYLNLHHRELFQKLLPLESQESDQVIVEPTKKGSLTMKIKWNDKIRYLHSKYDPEHEAARLIEKWTNVEKYEQVLFVGIGLGYHIKQFANQYPAMKFSIYEPNPEVLVQFFTHINIKDWPLKNVQSIFTGTDKQQLTIEIQKLLNNGKNILVIPLTAYETIYVNELTFIMKALKEQLLHERTNVATNAAFQKRWTINAIKNFPYVMKTPNILHDVDPSMFKGKPAIIVSAGPSLSEEFENLRYIKENGLAYIFSVGSAINALISHDIYPDAACTYDPQAHNYRVIQIIKDKGITDIPLIFGSTVGYETLENYPGPMLHMIINQDTVSSYLLGRSEKKNLEILQDAPSIAVVTFELLCRLGAGPIILVGQNLAYLHNRHYAEGISYGNGSDFISDEKLKNLPTVKNVYGEEVPTNEGFNQMRRQLEFYIQSYSQVKVINTTKGGAHIEGTEFIDLDRVIKQYLTGKSVENNWYKSTIHYERQDLSSHIRKVEQGFDSLENLFSNLHGVLNNLDRLAKLNSNTNLENVFKKFDKAFSKLRKNLFYQVFIHPMMRVQNKRLEETFQSIRFHKNLVQKAEIIVNETRKFLMDCHAHIRFIEPYFKELKEFIESEC